MIGIIDKTAKNVKNKMKIQIKELAKVLLFKILKIVLEK